MLAVSPSRDQNQSCTSPVTEYYQRTPGEAKRTQPLTVKLILGQLKWESLKKRRKDNRLILLYKGLKGKAKIPTDDLIPKTRRGRNQQFLAFQKPSASKDVYMYSFFPQTIRDGCV